MILNTEVFNFLNNEENLKVLEEESKILKGILKGL